MDKKELETFIINTLLNIVTHTYFSLNPYNLNNTEDNYQDLLKKNLELEGITVYSEYSKQKISLDKSGNNYPFSNKTERIDLFLPEFNLLLELKNLTDFKDECLGQITSYMDNDETINYGLLINFAKPKKVDKVKELKSTIKVFERNQLKQFTDYYGNIYKKWNYKEILEYKTENYCELFGEKIISTCS
jgi:hypothetical protein